MNASYMELSYGQVALAAALIVVNGALSLLLQLGLGRRLLVASGRMTVQLLLVGLVLKWIFQLSRWEAVLGFALLMVATAGIAAVGRTEHRYAGVWVDSILSVWVSSWAIMAIALLAIFRVEPWYNPQYSIPLLGMVLGNTLNGVSLGLERLGQELAGHRDRVEALLALGATRWEAARLPIQQAVRTGMIPTLNSMAVTGIVSLPGMMTGQMLSGVAPIEAVKYQIVIFFLIASATALGTVGVVLLGYRRLFNAHHQFLYRLLTDRR
jgi:putative ABC transport system permease protein